jgi:hypothetical protein
MGPEGICLYYCYRPILLNNSTFKGRGSTAADRRREVRSVEALFLELAMLFGADLDRHFCHFLFYRAQPLRHSS